jgi:hypothetical protein
MYVPFLCEKRSARCATRIRTDGFLLVLVPAVVKSSVLERYPAYRPYCYDSLTF